MLFFTLKQAVTVVNGVKILIERDCGSAAAFPLNTIDDFIRLLVALSKTVGLVPIPNKFMVHMVSEGAG